MVLMAMADSADMERLGHVLVQSNACSWVPQLSSASALIRRALRVLCVSVHAGLHAGAKRGILGLSGVEEDVGMIGLHWNDRFLELVPWTGRVEWEVCPLNVPCTAQHNRSNWRDHAGAC